MIPLILAVAGVLSAMSSVKSLVDTPPAAAADPSQATVSGTPAASFSDTLQSAVTRLDEAVATANEKAKAFASGDRNVTLSDVIVSLDQANLALQAAAAVRDKVVSAYSNVMNMPV
jgi:flagellar hook-basal body complex protein FliE